MLPNMRDVTQPANNMKAVDRGKHIEAYIDEMKQTVPLLVMRSTLRSRILGTALHYHYWGDADWAQRVRAKNIARDQAAHNKQKGMG